MMVGPQRMVHLEMLQVKRDSKLKAPGCFWPLGPDWKGFISKHKEWLEQQNSTSYGNSLKILCDEEWWI